MKTNALVLIAILFATLESLAQENEGATVTVTIENVLSDEGKVIASIHTEATFMKGPGIINLESEIEDGKVTLVFEDLPKGTYAVMAMHDANDNNRMDYEANGMPKESYGMSGNDMTMGPPIFEAAKFEVNGEDLNFNIRF